MMQEEEKYYDVLLKKNMEIIGFTIGPSWGGLVYDPDGVNVVGQIGSYPGDQRYVIHLVAKLPHSTGRQWDGEPIVVDNRPSKRFN